MLKYLYKKLAIRFIINSGFDIYSCQLRITAKIDVFNIFDLALNNIGCRKRVFRDIGYIISERYIVFIIN